MVAQLLAQAGLGEDAMVRFHGIRKQGRKREDIQHRGRWQR
jgi:hypothetical protein